MVTTLTKNINMATYYFENLTLDCMLFMFLSIMLNFMSIGYYLPYDL